MQPTVGCLIISDQFSTATYHLAKQLHLPVFTSPTQEKIDFWLYFDDKGLCLKHTNVITVDFTIGKNNYRRLYGGGRNQSIAKAIGLKHGHNIKVLDATAGLGRDAFVLASLGCSVTLIEQSPIITALLEDGLKRAACHSQIAQIIKRMHLIHTNSIPYMQQLSSREQPDIVYLDPMFPTRKKSALPQKEMQVLKALLNEETNEPALLNTALHCAKKRVVVKRPQLSRPINDQKPNFTIPGKSCRFDIYTIN